MKALVRFVSRTVCHSSTEYSWGCFRMLVPALFTRMSSRPKRSTAFCTSSRHEASRRTSTATASAFAPRAWSSFTAASLFAALRAATTTAAPACASPRAMPRPIPPFPPVTMATRPVRSKSFIAPCLLSSLDAQPGIEGVAQAVAEQVQAEPREGEGQPREQAHPEGLADHVLPAGDHVPPRGDVGRDADPEEAQDRLGQDRVREDERPLDQERPHAVRQDVAERDREVPPPEAARRLDVVQLADREDRAPDEHRRPGAVDDGDAGDEERDAGPVEDEAVDVAPELVGAEVVLGAGRLEPVRWVETRRALGREEPT